MPISHRGFSAWIESDNKKSPEYLVAVDEAENKVSCWIAGVAGQKFTVFWQDHSGGVDTCAFITLDGHNVPGRFLQGNGVASRSGVRTSTRTERPFVFREIPVEDTASLVTAKDAGMITLKIKRIQRVQPEHAKPIKALNLPTVLGKRKIGDLCVGFGEDEPVYERHNTTWKVLPYEKDATPGSKPITYVTFIFRYRSFEFLESQNIATAEQKKVDAPTTNPPVAAQGATTSNTRPSKKKKVQPSLSVATVPSTANNTPIPSPASSASGPIANPAMPPPYIGPYISSMATNAAVHPPYVMQPPMYPMAYMYPTYNVGPNPHMPVFTPIVPPYSHMEAPSSHQPSPVAPTSQIPSTSTATPSATTSKATRARRAPASRVNATVSTARAASVSSRMVPTSARRPSAETKRAVSWTAGTVSETVSIGPYNGQSQFFIARNTLQGSTLMNMSYADNSGTSESPDTTGEESPI